MARGGAGGHVPGSASKACRRLVASPRRCRRRARRRAYYYCWRLHTPHASDNYSISRLRVREVSDRPGVRAAPPSARAPSPRERAEPGRSAGDSWSLMLGFECPVTLSLRRSPSDTHRPQPRTIPETMLPLSLRDSHSGLSTTARVPPSPCPPCRPSLRSSAAAGAVDRGLVAAWPRTQRLAHRPARDALPPRLFSPVGVTTPLSALSASASAASGSAASAAAAAARAAALATSFAPL